jgi:hypothetical protein
LTGAAGAAATISTADLVTAVANAVLNALAITAGEPVVATAAGAITSVVAAVDAVTVRDAIRGAPRSTPRFALFLSTPALLLAFPWRGRDHEGKRRACQGRQQTSSRRSRRKTPDQVVEVPIVHRYLPCPRVRAFLTRPSGQWWLQARTPSRPLALWLDPAERAAGNILHSLQKDV